MFKKISIILTSVVLSACASNSAQHPPLSYEHCKFPDAINSPAPAWVCSAPVENLVIQGVGYSPRLGSGIGMMTDAAATEARAQIAGNFSTFISSRLQSLIDEQTIDGERLSVSNIERVQRSVTSMQLVDTRIYQTLATPGGGVYVLVGLTADAYEKNLSRLLEESEITDDPSLYHRFLVEEANRELDVVREAMK